MESLHVLVRDPGARAVARESEHEREQGGDAMTPAGGQPYRGRPGRRRNEDALYVGEQLFAVADGLGGHVAGDVAGGTAIEALAGYDRRCEPRGSGATLGRAVAAADPAIRRRVIGEPELAGMGTALVALLRSGPAAVLANVGDSRAYFCAAGRQGAGVRPASLRITRTGISSPPRRGCKNAGQACPFPGRAAGRSIPGPNPPHAAPRRPGAAVHRRAQLVRRRRFDPPRAGGVRDGGRRRRRLVQLAMDSGAPDNVTVLVLDA